jgi:hypothetical protein
MAETPEQRGLDHSESRLWRYCSWMAASRERSALFNGAVASGWAVVIDNSTLETNLFKGTIDGTEKRRFNLRVKRRCRASWRLRSRR